MNLKKFSLILIIFLILPITAFADCSTCSISDCTSCGCVLNKDGTRCIYSNYNDSRVSCGDKVDNIPATIPKFTSILYKTLQIAVPILLVIFCMIDLVKAITSGKDDEIKKKQGVVIKRLIAAVLIFFIFALVKFLISVVADNNSEGIIDCVSCFIENNCG